MRGLGMPQWYFEITKKLHHPLHHSPGRTCAGVVVLLEAGSGATDVGGQCVTCCAAFKTPVEHFPQSDLFQEVGIAVECSEIAGASISRGSPPRPSAAIFCAFPEGFWMRSQLFLESSTCLALWSARFRLGKSRIFCILQRDTETAMTLR